MSRSRVMATALAIGWALACPLAASAQERFPPAADAASAPPGGRSGP